MRLSHASATHESHLAFGARRAFGRAPSRRPGSAGQTPRHDGTAIGAPVYTFSPFPVASAAAQTSATAAISCCVINHVAFIEGESGHGRLNRTVSRRHARIELDEAPAGRGSIDDNSAQGTSSSAADAVRGAARSRGLGLQTGDEIVLGQARIKVRLS